MNPPSLALLAVACLAVVPATGQEPIETVEVIGTTPIGGTLDADRVASNVQTATSESIRERGALDLADFINRSFTNVFINEAQNNPLQPDVRYRGFVGSPLLGLPQGIAVYQDAVRINEPFGDTVNWALIPESAIDTVHLVPGSNPLFGLNALGGAISIRTKNGFDHRGSTAELSAGSFSRTGIEAETGGQANDRIGYFVAASYLEEDGWRNHSPTEATQLFSKLTWLLNVTRIDASLSLADTDLIGNGAAPIELLRVDRKEIFTRPDRTQNELAQINLEIDHVVSDGLTLNGNLYLRRSDAVTLNGDDTDFEECERTPGFICVEEDGEEEITLDRTGRPITADESLEGATVNRTGVEQEGAGVGLQLGWDTDVAGRANALVAGLSHDGSDVVFDASTELGRLDATRRAVPGGVFVGDAFTRLRTSIRTTGLFFSDTISLSDTLAVTVSGRFNRTEIDLNDRLGTALDGSHEFDRFNPALGLTYALAEDKTFFASFSESSRVPSPVELTCADEDDPCRLPNAFLSDPPLDQVIASTYEIGIRGAWADGNWSAAAFRTTNANDILFISAGALTNEGFFDNVGRTRRQGFELSISAQPGPRASWFANYSFLNATFRQDFTVASPNNPAAADGETPVRRGSKLPLIPDHLLKMGGRLSMSERLTVSGDLLATSGFHLRGDEGNLNGKLGSHAVLNLRAEYRLSEATMIFLKMNNVLDEEYETFGLFGEPGEVLGDGFQDSRFLSPGAPRAAWLGVRLTF